MLSLEQNFEFLQDIRYEVGLSVFNASVLDDIKKKILRIKNINTSSIDEHKYKKLEIAIKRGVITDFQNLLYKYREQLLAKWESLIKSGRSKISGTYREMKLNRDVVNLSYSRIIRHYESIDRFLQII